MRKFLMAAAVLAVVACGEKNKTGGDSTGAMAPPAAMSPDSSMSHDSGMAATMNDSAKKDSTMKKDSTE